MKLHLEDRHVNTNIQETAQKAVIEMNAIAFHALSSMVYKDPILAIVRELLCNAADSHVSAGKEQTPIRVHIPTRITPVLEIQDYGLGMSHEQITSIYKDYFKSDKRTDDTLTGGFGIGSKTPYSYTDQFSVVSVHGGIKSTYAMFKDESGIPSCVRVLDIGTDDCNGVTVTVPVKDGDRWKFEITIDKVMGSFDLPIESNYKLCGNVFSPCFTLDDGSEVRIDNRYSGITVIQNRVEYSQSFSGVCTPGLSFTIKVPDGTFAPTLSRESLTTDEKSVAKIKGYYGEVLGKIDGYTESEIEKQPNVFEARRRFEELLTLTMLNFPFEWRGITLENANDITGICGVSTEKGRRGGRMVTIDGALRTLIKDKDCAPDSVYWGKDAISLRPYYKGNLLPDEKWDLHLFGNQEESEKILNKLGFDWSIVKTLSEHRTKYRKYLPSNGPSDRRPKATINGEEIRLDSRCSYSDCIIDGSDWHKLYTLSRAGVSIRQPKLISFRTNVDKGKKIALAGGAHLNVDEYVRSRVKLDYEKVNTATALAEFYKKAKESGTYSNEAEGLVNDIMSRNLNLAIASKLPLVCSLRRDRVESDPVLLEFADMKKVSKLVVGLEKQYSKELKEVERFKAKHPEVFAFLTEGTSLSTLIYKLTGDKQ